ncbi:hypothetical protein LINPERPRIM_LOCUS33264 [Linum perenne]
MRWIENGRLPLDVRETRLLRRFWKTGSDGFSPNLFRRSSMHL